jgi:hypothetical protein
MGRKKKLSFELVLMNDYTAFRTIIPYQWVHVRLGANLTCPPVRGGNWGGVMVG